MKWKVKRRAILTIANFRAWATWPDWTREREESTYLLALLSQPGLNSLKADDKAGRVGPEVQEISLSSLISRSRYWCLFSGACEHIAKTERFKKQDNPSIQRSIHLSSSRQRSLSDFFPNDWWDKSLLFGMRPSNELIRGVGPWVCVAHFNLPLSFFSFSFTRLGCGW